MKKKNKSGIKTLLLIIVCVGLGFAGCYYYINYASISKQEETIVTRLSFQDIGEFATEEMIGTVVRNEESTRHIIIDIPFTTKHYIYSYDFEIKAGFDFGEITWKLDEGSKTINVTLPEAKILSTEVLTDSLVVYLEENNIFNQMHIEENNEALSEMQEEAKEKAIDEGIYDKATENAKTLLKTFFAQEFDLDTYTIVFN